MIYVDIAKVSSELIINKYLFVKQKAIINIDMVVYEISLCA